MHVRYMASLWLTLVNGFTLFGACPETLDSANRSLEKVEIQLKQNYETDALVARRQLLTQQITDLEELLDSATLECAQQEKVDTLRDELALWKRVKKDDRRSFPKAKDQYLAEIDRLLIKKKQSEIDSATFEAAIHDILINNKTLEENRPKKTKLIEKEIENCQKKYNDALLKAEKCSQEKIKKLTDQKDILLKEKTELDEKGMILERSYETKKKALSDLKAEYYIQTALGMLKGGEDSTPKSDDPCRALYDQQFASLVPILGEFQSGPNKLTTLWDLTAEPAGLYGIFQTNNIEQARVYLPVCYFSQYLVSENQDSTLTGEIENTKYFFERKLAHIFFKEYEETKLVLNPDTPSAQKLKFYFSGKELARFSWEGRPGSTLLNLKPVKSRSLGLLIKVSDQELIRQDLTLENLNLIKYVEKLAPFSNSRYYKKLMSILAQFADKREGLTKFIQRPHPVWLTPRYILKWLDESQGA